MNADNRETRSPFGGFTAAPASDQQPQSRPVAPSGVQPQQSSTPPQSAPSVQPARGPQSDQQPVRPLFPNASSQPPPSGSAQQTRQPQVSGQQPISPAPASANPGPAPQSSGQTPQRSSIRGAVSGQSPTNSGVSFQGGAGFPSSASATPTSQAKSSTATMTAVADDAPRKARVMVSRIDPRSALKIGFLLSVAAGVMLTVAVYVIWNVLNSMGFFALANEWVSKLFTEDQELNLMQFFHQGRVMSATILISVVNVFLLTALSVIWAFLYNTVSTVVGGIYVTLADD